MSITGGARSSFGAAGCSRIEARIRCAASAGSRQASCATWVELIEGSDFSAVSSWVGAVLNEHGAVRKHPRQSVAPRQRLGVAVEKKIVRQPHVAVVRDPSREVVRAEPDVVIVLA